MATTSQTKEVLSQYDKLSAITAVVVIVLLTIVYFFCDQIFPQNWCAFIQSLILNTIPILVTFVISYTVFRKILTIKQKQNTEELSQKLEETLVGSLKKELAETQPDGNPILYDFNEIEWDKILNNCVRLDIFVHYFDTWVRNNSAHLEAIFNRGGTIRLIIPDYEKTALVKLVKRRFPEYDLKLIKSKIENTKEKIQLLKDTATHQNANFECYLTEELGYYCGIRVDERFLSLSHYDHIRNKLRIESPTFIVNLEKNKTVSSWFEKEFTGIISSSKRLP